MSATMNKIYIKDLLKDFWNLHFIYQDATTKIPKHRIFQYFINLQKVLTYNEINPYLSNGTTRAKPPALP